ncbi:MAG: hypothetical protein ACI9MX_003898 [Candidatus Aldehydirespiratoraceae bacterium]|jgi:hypothetical protein
MKKTSFLFGIWVIVLLLTPGVFGLIGVHPNRVQSGAQTSAPTFQADRLLQRSYYGEVDAYVRSETPVRGLGLWSRSLIDYELFGDSWQPFVAAGANDFLFFRFQVDLPCGALAAINPPTLPEALDSDPDSRVFVVLNSGKHAFYGDLLKAHDQPEPCVVDERAAARQRMSEATFAIDVDAALESAAAAEEVFFRHDTHWSPTGRMVAAETLIDAIAPGLWDPGAVIEDEIPELAALGRFLGRTEGVVSGPTVSRPAIDLTTMNQQTTADGLIQSQRTRATGAPVISGRTLLIGDSQMAYLVPEIESYFEDLEFFLWDSLATTSSLPSAEGVDRVIVQSVETAAGRRFAHPQLERVFGELVKSDDD